MVKGCVTLPSGTVEVTIPENVQEAQDMGVDVDLAVSLGYLCLTQDAAAAMMERGETGAMISLQLLSGNAVPTAPRALIKRMKALSESDRQEFERLLLQELSS